VSQLHTRRAGPADLDVVVELRLALLREYADHPVYGRLRTDAEQRARPVFSAQLRAADQVILLAEDADGCQGIARCVESHGSPLLHPDRYAYLSSVYVRPAARRRGVLRALMAAVEAWCDTRGLTEIRLHNSATSPAAIATWDRLGFEASEQVRVRRL
jgi:GNAT superfamily N-acetyltransferase